MNSLDLILLVVLAIYAMSGFAQGFVVNLAATLGMVTGGLAAIILVPNFMPSRGATLSSSLLALALVVAAAGIGQIIGTAIGTEARESVRAPGAKFLDSLGGSAMSIGAVLVVSWAIGYAVSGTAVPYLGTAARDSTILAAVDDFMPDEASRALRSFNKTLDANVFPRYINPFEDEPIESIGVPNDASLQAPGVQQAAGSVFKILGMAKCGTGIEGSGFAYAPNRVMTNAHVVAGVSAPVVEVNGDRMRARVVVFNPELDLAVLAVDGLGARPLQFDFGGERGQEAVVLGFPENGPFDARAARIRQEITMRSPDIYAGGEHLREVFSLRGLVRSGNSGGPLVSTDGSVIGVIFAAAVTDSATGYALTAEQAAGVAQQGARASAQVDTRECA